MNKQLFAPLLLISLLSTAVLKSAAQDYYYTDCDSFKIDDSFKVVELDEHEFKRSFSERTYIYCSPDSTQQPLGFVNFNTSLTSFELVSNVRRDSFVMHSNRPNDYRYIYDVFTWHKVTFRNGFGYVKASDLADSFYPEGPLLAKVMGGSYVAGVQLKAMVSDPKKKPSIAQITVPYMHGYRMHILCQNGLENSGTLIHYETFRQSCPGATNTILISLSEEGFTKVISSSSGGEAGMFNQETIYFPLKITEDSVQLCAMEYLMLNEMEGGDFNLKDIGQFNYPKNIGVPIERLIVKSKSYTQNILDENGKELMDENDNYRVNIIDEAPVYYKWNGTELLELGSSYYLNRLDSLENLAIDSIHANSTIKQSDSLLKLGQNPNLNIDKPGDSRNLISGLIGFIIGGLVIGIVLFIRRKRG